MELSEINAIKESVEKLAYDFRIFNANLSYLNKWSLKVCATEQEATDKVNVIYHALEVKDFAGSEKMKIMKHLTSALRDRRDAKIAREYIEAISSKFEDLGIQFRPMANESVEKCVNKVKHKHNGISAKSKSNIASLESMIKGC